LEPSGKSAGARQAGSMQGHFAPGKRARGAELSTLDGTRAGAHSILRKLTDITPKYSRRIFRM